MLACADAQGPAPQGFDRIEDGEDLRQGSHHPQQERCAGESDELKSCQSSLSRWVCWLGARTKVWKGVRWRSAGQCLPHLKIVFFSRDAGQPGLVDQSFKRGAFADARRPFEKEKKAGDQQSYLTGAFDRDRIPRNMCASVFSRVRIPLVCFRLRLPREGRRQSRLRRNPRAHERGNPRYASTCSGFPIYTALQLFPPGRVRSLASHFFSLCR